MVRKYVKILLLKRIARCNERRIWASFYHEIYSKCRIKKMSSLQYKQIQDYYKKNWGKRINTGYHEYYYSMTGIFSEKYIPDTLYFDFIDPCLNNHRMVAACVDKNGYRKLFPEVKQPDLILSNINGYYYHEDTAITEQKAIEICSELPDAIIKPSLDSCQGKNVARFESKGGLTNLDGLTVQQLLKKYDRNFLVQKTIHQHPVMESLNPSSVNTVRVLTLRRENEIICLSAIVRIGREGSVVDNGHAGGYCCGVDESGQLKENGFICATGECRQKTDQGTVLKNVTVPYFNHIVETAKNLHFKLPYLNLVGWDFCVDDKNEIVLIEFNTNSALDIMQLCNGPVFGDYTEEILRKISGSHFNIQINRFLER